ncbi:universal stress protein [Cereibacter sphaeroides]|uniref:universal stress protein n=1 Tax=Rhodobacterales TaxID=204455 RepID=UPI000BBE7C91|nr:MULTISPECIES: universal stress protein [Paracoccaceae]MCE6950529.1 universal stress protein [Cereibacter sphaeroides]MCE6959438.1 universal stress protein [Cereibacter sphaeroides]MCE6968289.1 universal stress protein [Cereibacter sphaeroides]MCE6973791.1 universal stress protein [Cereibacter sphaeroides]
MAYKSLLSVATSPDRVEPVLSVASRLALAEDAHLDVLALGIDGTQVAYYNMGGTAVVLQMALERAEQEAQAVEKAARAALAAQPVTLRSSVETAVAQMGGLSGLVAMRSRFADLVVLPRPYGKGRGAEAEAVVEAALFEGQAPVLVIPDDASLSDHYGNRIIIAWDQSREALTAVRKAMPFLLRAEVVNIVIVDPSAHGAERSDPGGALCQMLVRHGVRAEVSVLAKTLPRVSDVIARHVRDQNGDLLVMGAYGHSRFREAIIGGATRDMLELAEVPVLMAH